MIISISRKKALNYYDENKEIKERVTLSLLFTIDQRFIDPATGVELTKSVSIIVI